MSSCIDSQLATLNAALVQLLQAFSKANSVAAVFKIKERINPEHIP